MYSVATCSTSLETTEEVEITIETTEVKKTKFIG